ncbi:MAG: hypothetical protein GY796_12875 [Chloroflexi bacterium]|nr:hypothetical protein [Chloroflexota bacterium]
MDEVNIRIIRMVERILENESLTSNLEDEAAKALINWGVALVEMLGKQTAGMEDAEAEEALYPQEKAVRRLMRLINRWALHLGEDNSATSQQFMPQILEQIVRIYGDKKIIPERPDWEAFLSHSLVDSPTHLVVSLRNFTDTF